MSAIIAGIRVPDSAIARAATQLVRDTEEGLLYNHSRRVFFWGALAGERRGTFGNVKADVPALKDMNYVHQNVCAIILGSAWPN